MSTSHFDLHLGDLDEVRRRVVDPVLAAMLRPGELVRAELVIDEDWPGSDDAGWAFHRWPNNPHATPPGSEPRSLYLVIHAVGNEQHTVQLGSIAFYLDSAIDRADSLKGSLSDWICETRFGWADARTAEDLVLPGPRLDEQGRPRIEIWATEGDNPLTVDRVPTDPAELGLSASLTADLRAWRALGATAADEAEAEAQRRFGDRISDREFFGMTAAFVDDAVAARQAAVAREARELAHLGSWRRLVARLEPMRDALLERARDELGESFWVPTPTRIP